MSRSKQRGLLAMMSMALMVDGYGVNYPEVDYQERKIQAKTPKGAKEYFFNAHGEFSTEQMLNNEIVFKCFAINDKNALRKFERGRQQKN